MSLRRQFTRTIMLAAVAVAACTDSTVDSPENPSGITSRANVTGDPVIVAAGDAVCGSGTPAGTACQHAAVATLIGTLNPTAVLLLGDNQYENGTLADYNAFYNPTWGAHKAITLPAPGNHEYNTANASGYYDYFNGVGVQTGAAGNRAQGYYSVDIGAWHIVSLNSNCAAIGGCGVGSPQEQWLRSDLAAHPAACTLAYWHHPRFSSGQHGNDATVQALWQALMDFGAELVLNGHEHNYERFAPQNATGGLNTTIGLIEIVAGTGGKEHRTFSTIRANSLVRNNTSFGVIRLTLHPTSYDFDFVPIPGDPAVDSGSGTCHGLGTNQSPTATITAPANNASFVQGTSVTFTGSGSDPETGALSGGALVWTSSIAGQIGTGTTFSTSGLAVGTHTITLTARDPQNATGTATRTITITSAQSNQAPVARFTANCVGQNNARQCAFDATTSTDDVAITQYSWNWGTGQPIESGTSPTTRHTFPANGTYTVTLTVRDGGGLTNSASLQVTVPAGTNQPPTATITAPVNGASFAQGASVTFTGSGSDPETGALTGSALVWTSNISGQIGTGTSFSTSSLAAGTHTITLTARDPQNATGTATRSITIVAPNQPPTATITAPANGASFAQGASVTFTGSGSDPETGALTGSALVWTSNISGQIGTGTSFSTSNLAAGTHTITLTARDPQNATGSATRTISITATQGNQPPIARFTFTCVGQRSPRQCAFDASTSTDDVGIVQYSWNWGSGQPIENGTSPTTRNTFPAGGTYTVTLTVRDAAGLTHSVSQQVTVP